MSLRRFVFIVCCFTLPTFIFACCKGLGGDNSESESLRSELAACQAQLATMQTTSMASAYDNEPSPAPIESPLANVCSSIELHPTHEVAFSVASSSVNEYDFCVLVLEAKQAIPRLAFNWVQYDADGVKLNDGIEILKDLAVGDKVKVEFSTEDGVAKIVSAPRR